MKNAYIAEFIGTLVLATLVTLSVTSISPLVTPIVAALTLGLFVYTTGHISGTHINPAITLGAWSVKKITNTEALYYVGAQILAGICAFAAVNFINPHFNVGLQFTMHDFMGEVLGTALFAFGVASAVLGKIPSQMSGIVVGGSLLLGIVCAALIGSAGALNPAVAIGLGLFVNPAYMLGSLIGGVIGFQIYALLNK